MKNNLKVKHVMDVKIDDVNLTEAVSLVSEWLKGEGKHYIVTPNPEFVMAAQKDDDFKKVLNGADLAIPDGVGLKWFGGVKNVLGGVYFVEDLCRLAVEKGLAVGFLGGRDGVAKKAAECLQERYPKLKVALAEDGPLVNEKGDEVSSISYMVYRGKKQKEELSQHTKYEIPNTDILFVGFGQVKQEKWIAKNLSQLPVRVAMGVGGAIDELAGKGPNPPKWVWRIGFKWLYRLILQPWRIKRQTALGLFVVKMISRSILG